MTEKLFKKAVLIYPKFYDDTFWSFRRSLARYVPKGEFGLPKRTMPPLGLMGLYRHLKKHYYEDVVLIDRNVDPRPLKNLIKDADHIFMGGMITQEKGFIKDALIVKNLGKILIAGGTIVDENSPLMDIADHLVENEAEMVIDKLILGLFDGTAKKYYEGMPALPEKFFIPDFSSINRNNYISMTIQLSRGCPEDCEFCDITARFGRIPRLTPWKHIETMLRQLHKLGSKQPVFVVDDNFIGDPIRTIEVLKKMYMLEKELGYSFAKSTELTLRLADETPIMEKLRGLLRKTNFNMFFIGVETNNVASLIETGKLQNLSEKKTIQEKLSFISKKTGASITLGMIYGFDNDNRLLVDSFIDFINSTHSPTVMVGLLNAMHYTKLWDRLEKEGRLSERSSGNNSDGRINFIPYNMSAKQAEQDYVKILKGIYNEKAFFKRVMKELKLFNPNFPDNTRTLKETICIGIKLLTDRKNTFTLLKYLPEVHRIAERRSGFNTSKYRYLVGAYMGHCAKYLHFKGHMLYLEKQQKRRKYEPWQLYSWKELQESRIVSIDVLENAIEEPISLYQKIRMKLDNNYEFVGTRLEALKQFAAPYLEEKLEKIKNRVPSLKNFLDTEIAAYRKVHLKRPKILGKIKFSKVEKHLRKSLQDKKDYLVKMQRLYRKAVSAKTLKKTYSI